MIDPRAFKPLVLDGEAVRRLLPHRPPLLLVDGVEAISAEPPALKAFKQIDASEPVLAGHFPSRPIWPGVYCIEGLAQTCALLGALLQAQGTPGTTTDGFTAILANADVKLTAPVTAGQRLEYLVVHTHTIDAVLRFDVEAAVQRRVVAKGTLTVAVGPR